MICLVREVRFNDTVNTLEPGCVQTDVSSGNYKKNSSTLASLDCKQTIDGTLETKKTVKLTKTQKE